MSLLKVYRRCIIFHYHFECVSHQLINRYLYPKSSLYLYPLMIKGRGTMNIDHWTRPYTSPLGIARGWRTRSTRPIVVQIPNFLELTGIYLNLVECTSFCGLWKLCHWWTDRRTDPRTKPLTELFCATNKADRPANCRELWAGALMEVRSLFGLNSAIKITCYRRTDRHTQI